MNSVARAINQIDKVLVTFLKSCSLLGLSLAISTATISPGACAQETNVADELAKAQSLMSNNKLGDALHSVRQVLIAHPNNKQARQMLDELYQKAGADPKDVGYRLKTAADLFNQGHYKEAEVEYRTSLCLKMTPDAYVGLGRVAEKLQGPGEGKAEFDRALDVDPNFPEAHRELGKFYLQTRDMVAANSELSKALVANPKDSEASQNLIKLWQEQVAHLPNANSHMGLARAYQLSGNLPAAQAEYKEVVRIDPNHPNLPAARQSFKLAEARQIAEQDMASAHTLELKGMLQEAYRLSTEAVVYSPGNAKYQLFQGEVLEKMGQAAPAKQVYLNILEYDPQNAEVIERLKHLTNVPVPAPVMQPQAQTALSPSQLQGFDGSKFPWEGTGNTTSLAPDAGNLQISTLGSFMSLLRGQMLSRNGAAGAPAAAGMGGALTGGALTGAPDSGPASAGQSAGGRSMSAMQAAMQADDFLNKSIAPAPLNQNPNYPTPAGTTAVQQRGKTTGTTRAGRQHNAKSQSIEQKMQMLQKQNQQMENQIKQLNDSQQEDDEPPPSNPGGLYIGPMSPP